MPAQTGRIDAAFGWSGHRLREGRGASCRGGWCHPERGVARAECATVIPLATRLHVPALVQPIRRLKADDAKGRQARFGHSVRAMQAPTGGDTSPKQDYDLEPTSLPRGAVLRTGD